MDQSILSKTFDLFSVLTLLFSVHNFKISFSAIRFLKAENMATTPMSAFLFILYILQTIPQDLTPGYGNNYYFFKEMFFMGSWSS